MGAASVSAIARRALPEALGLWNGSLFTALPLTLGTLDPAFTLPAAAVVAQLVLLTAGTAALFLRPGRPGNKLTARKALESA